MYLYKVINFGTGPYRQISIKFIVATGAKKALEIARDRRSGRQNVFKICKIEDIIGLNSREES